MTSFRTTNFGGMVPRLSERLLPDASARIAANCNVASGELVPMRRSRGDEWCSLYTGATYTLSVGYTFPP